MNAATTLETIRGECGRDLSVPISFPFNDRFKAFALFALALLVYGFGIGREFVFDDIVYISQNQLLHQPGAFGAFWFTSEAFNYYPLFWSILRVQWLLWGDHPLGYHLVNLLVHCTNAVLLWRIARAWRIPGAWFVAALFAVHPVNVQTLAWAAEQKNTWSFLFMALSTLAFIRHAERRDGSSYAISLLCFVAALACKTSTVCLPVFLLIRYAFSRERNFRFLALRLIPFFAIGLAAGATTIWFERNRAGIGSLVGTLSLWERMETAGAVFWFYLEKALVPIGLTPMYRGWVDTTAAAHGAIPGLLLVLLLVACAFAWRRIGAAVALGLGYYVLMMLPLLGIFDTNYFAYSLVADHWQYHALPGVLVAVAAIARKLVSRAPTFNVGGASSARRSEAKEAVPRLFRYSNLLGAGTVATAAVLASLHFAHFDDAPTLWRYTVTKNPEAWIAWYNLGNDHADKREYAEAIADYERCLQITPSYYRARFNLAHNLAAAGRLEEADRAYLHARELAPNDPDGYVNRGALLLRLNRDTEARAELIRALQLDPHKASAAVNLVIIELHQGRVEQAGKYLRRDAVASNSNSRRIADAITGNAPNEQSDREALARFADRACLLSGGQHDLIAARAALLHEPGR